MGSKARMTSSSSAGMRTMSQARWSTKRWTSTSSSATALPCSLFSLTASPASCPPVPRSPPPPPAFINNNTHHQHRRRLMRMFTSVNAKTALPAPMTRNTTLHLIRRIAKRKSSATASSPMEVSTTAAISATLPCFRAALRLSTLPSPPKASSPSASANRIERLNKAAASQS